MPGFKIPALNTFVAPNQSEGFETNANCECTLRRPPQLGCKSQCKPLGEKIELFWWCCLRPHTTCPGPAPGWPWWGEVTIGGRYLLSGHIIHYRRVITNCLSFVRTIPWSLIGFIRRTAAMWSVNSEPRTWWSESPQVEQSGAMKARSRQRTWDRSNREPARGRKGVSQLVVSTGFLNLLDFFWFYVDWTKRDQLLFYIHSLKEGSSYFVSL